MRQIGERGQSMRCVYTVVERGRTFSTRPRGAELRESLLQEMKGAEHVTLDFSGVLSISYSFADEFVGRLEQAADQSQVPFGLSVIGASDEVQRVIDRARSNRAEVADEVEPPCFA